MNRIFKYKKIIVLLLIFTLSFGVVSNYNRKEVKAVAVVDDIILWILGGLVLGTGIAALSNSQQKHNGKLVFDEFFKRGYSEGELLVKGIDGVVKGVKITNKLKEIVNSVAGSLPTTDIIDTSYTSDNSWDLSNPFEIPMTLGGLKKNDMQLLVTGVVSGLSDDGASFSVSFGGKENFGLMVYNGDFIKIYNEASYNDNQMYVMAYAYRNGVLFNRTSYRNSFSPGISSVLKFSNVLVDMDVVGKDFNVLPYGNSKVKENYDEGLIEQSLPYTDDKAGYWEIPLENPFDKEVSEEMPLDWDKVKDQVQDLPTDIPINPPIDIPDNPSLDIPDSPVIDKPAIDNPIVNGIWDLIEGFLKAIFGMLKAILGFLLGLLTMILNGLLSLIKLLFYPTIALEDVFVMPDKSGLGNLFNLFSWDEIWSISPKPIEFIGNLNMKGVPFVGQSRIWRVELKPFDVVFLKNSLPAIRNVMSYSILISVIWAIVNHFLPKRDMD